MIQVYYVRNEDINPAMYQVIIETDSEYYELHFFESDIITRECINEVVELIQYILGNASSIHEVYSYCVKFFFIDDKYRCDVGIRALNALIYFIDTRYLMPLYDSSIRNNTVDMRWISGRIDS